MTRIYFTARCANIGCIDLNASATSFENKHFKHYCSHWKNINVSCKSNYGWLLCMNTGFNIELNLTCSKCLYQFSEHHYHRNWSFDEKHESDIVCKCGNVLYFGTYETKHDCDSLSKQNLISGIAPLKNFNISYPKHKDRIISHIKINNYISLYTKDFNEYKIQLNKNNIIQAEMIYIGSTECFKDLIDIHETKKYTVSEVLSLMSNIKLDHQYFINLYDSLIKDTNSNNDLMIHIKDNIDVSTSCPYILMDNSYILDKLNQEYITPPNKSLIGSAINHNYF
mgnify:CR=1 FL=1